MVPYNFKFRTFSQLHLLETMTLNLLIFAAILIYIFDVFILVWLSGKFAGIQPFHLSQVLILTLSILLFSWLAMFAFIHVPFELKPFILVLSAVVIIYIYIISLKTSFLKSLAAGFFFNLTQFVLILFLLRQFWNEHFFQIVKYYLFQYF